MSTYLCLSDSSIPTAGFEEFLIFRRGKMKKRLIVFLTLLVLVLGSSFVQAEIMITDDLDREISLEQKAERVVSLAPSNTEILFELGLEEKIVGVTEYCDYPKQALETNNVGAITEPNVEEIIELEPDLVVAAGINPMDIVDRLEELGITVVGFEPENISEIFTTIDNIAQLTGQQQEAKTVLKDLNERKAQVVETVEAEVDERPTVFYEIWKEPLTTAGGGTFINDIIELAGGENIAADAGEQWPQFSLEVLLAENPDIYLSSEHSWTNEVTKESILNRDNYDNLTAIQEERVAVLDQDLLSRGGPRIITGLEKVAEAIHPEIF